MEVDTTETKKENTGETTAKKILLVDDDKFLLEMYVNKFKSSGFDVVAFPSARDAIEVLKTPETHYNAILFDMIMPDMDGWTFLQEIRKNNLVPNTKLVVLSNEGAESDTRKAEQYNVDGYIVKALKTPSEVVAEINNIL